MYKLKYFIEIYLFFFKCSEKINYLYVVTLLHSQSKNSNF